MPEHGVSLKPCAGVSPKDDPEVQRALSHVHSEQTWMIQQLEGEDRWALFNDARELIAVGPWESIKSLYDPRKRQSRASPKGTTPDVQLDLGDLGL